MRPILALSPSWRAYSPLSFRFSSVYSPHSSHLGLLSILCIHPHPSTNSITYQATASTFSSTMSSASSTAAPSDVLHIPPAPTPRPFHFPRIDADHPDRALVEEFDLTPMEQRLEMTVGTRIPGTGLWFIEEPVIQRFVSAYSRRQLDPQILWLHGPPAQGKETLTATFAQTLLESYGREMALGWYSCSLLDHQRGRSGNVLRSLVAQLARQDTSVFRLLCAYLRESGGAFSYTTNDHLAWFLSRASKRFARTFLIVTNVNQCVIREMKEIFRVLTTLAATSDGMIRVMFTSSKTLDELGLIGPSSIQEFLVPTSDLDFRMLLRNKLGQLGIPVNQGTFDGILGRMNESDFGFAADSQMDGLR